jgi:drug/metabolite transporter (DMT)-like permease
VKPQRSPAIDFLLLASAWGSSFLFMRMGALEFGAWATAGLRVAFAALALLPLLLWRCDLQLVRRKAGPLLAVGLLNTALPFTFYCYALQHISTGLTSILNASSPLFGALVAWAWLREAPGRWRTLGLLLGFLGIVLLSWNKASLGGEQTALAVLACLGSTLCYGIAASCTRVYLAEVPPLTITAASLVGAALALVPTTIWFWPAQTPSLKAWGSVLLLGLLCTAWAYVLFYRLIAEAGASKALTVTFLVPLFALLYGALLLGETVTLAMAGYGLVILLGVALSTEAIKPQAWLARLQRT